MNKLATIFIFLTLTSFILCDNDKKILNESVSEKLGVIVSSDGEIDDEFSLVRFLLCANEWDIVGIVTLSSQYHLQGRRLAGDDWIDSQNDVGGWPELKSRPAPKDTDHDGMPDKWEKKNGLNPNNASDRNEIGEDGNTMPENFLNSFNLNDLR